MAIPILNIVPSYDVTSGVTLTFNSNYGTNLVRGSKAIIRDQDMNVVAWHINVPATYGEAATQHIIPSKQALINQSVAPTPYSDSATYPVDAVVAYNGATYICTKYVAGGITPDNIDYWRKLIDGEAILSYVSEDFNTAYVNESQMQITISVFVGYDINNYVVNLVGNSQNSSARNVWILPQPQITFDSIPVTIDTTSYTIGLTYSTEQVISTGRVYNPPQSMEFTLYKSVDGEWELVSQSGKIYNSGVAIDESRYYTNYPFYLLDNGATYKVSVAIDSLLGMYVEADSTPFTIDAVTYQISTFKLENDSCHGRVNVISEITDVIGDSNVEPSGGEIVLTHTDDYCKWDEGLGFTNNWTARLWGYDFNIASAIEPEQAVLHLGSTTTSGVIDGYIVQTPDNKYRFDLYVYPTGYDGVGSYFQSNVVDSLGSTTNPLCILIGFDYDTIGTYYVRIIS